MHTILLVEDDIALCTGVAFALENGTIKVLQAECIAKAKQLLAENTIDLILLDINLPDGNGLTFLQQIQQSNSNMPVILLTANDTEQEIVQGFQAGAQDYVVKPFSIAVLRARVETALKRANKNKEQIFLVGPYAFNFETMQFKKGELLLELSKTEQRLLKLLIENQGQVLKRDLLLEKVWDAADFVDENALSVAVKRLRDKLQDKKYLKTTYGIGYTWEKE